MIERLRRICERYGVQVRFGDLGSWGGVLQLRSEYDPEVPEIVVNSRIGPHLVGQAIAHELYHHREAIGDIARLPKRRERECAADAYAARLSAELQ